MLLAHLRKNNKMYLRNPAINFYDHLSADFQDRFNSESRMGAGNIALSPVVIMETTNVE